MTKVHKPEDIAAIQADLQNGSGVAVDFSKVRLTGTPLGDGNPMSLEKYRELMKAIGK